MIGEVDGVIIELRFWWGYNAGPLWQIGLVYNRSARSMERNNEVPFFLALWVSPCSSSVSSIVTGGAFLFPAEVNEDEAWLEEEGSPAGSCDTDGDVVIVEELSSLAIARSRASQWDCRPAVAMMFLSLIFSDAFCDRLGRFFSRLDIADNTDNDIQKGIVDPTACVSLYKKCG